MLTTSGSRRSVRNQCCRTLCAGLICILVAAGPIAAAAEPDWRWGPVLPIDKTCRATAAVGDLVVTIGGTRWQPRAEGAKVKQWLSGAWALDLNAMKWKSLPDYPVPAGYAFAAGINDRIYVIGGRGPERGNAETFVLDLSQESPCWKAGPVLPAPRWEHSGGVWQDTIVVAGGNSGDPSQKDGWALSPQIHALDTRDPAAGWRYVSDFPNAQIEYPVCAIRGNELFLFGGALRTSDGLDFLPQTEAYALHLTDRSWRKLRPLPESMFSGASVAMDERRILVAGGVTSIPVSLSPDGVHRLQVSSSCFVYDTLTGDYTTVQPLLEGVGDQGLVVAGSRVCCIGGEQTALKTRTDVVQIGNIHPGP